MVNVCWHQVNSRILPVNESVANGIKSNPHKIINSLNSNTYIAVANALNYNTPLPIPTDRIPVL
ncbi:hypothetical protein L1278_002426 [Pontibacter sp. HSC-36F09]|nr:hypothetical protein [Pontibacter sp. HSC-36F09]